MPAVYEALISSLDVNVALGGGFENLLRLVDADYGAVALAGLERDAVPDWVVQKHLPPAFLSAYLEMIEHDFLLSETLKQPNVVLRDDQMSTRRDFVRNPFVLRAREVGAPINQVMAVSLIIEGVGMCGLALYRERARPFTQHEQRMLQRIAPAFADAVRNGRQFGAASRRSRVLDVLLEDKGWALAIVRPPDREIERSAAADALLTAWFEPVERSGGRLPHALLDQLRGAVARHERGVAGPWRWTKPRHDADLVVEMRPVGDGTWAIFFEERSRRPTLPPEWEPLLTPRQREVAEKVICGWESHLIAAELGCSPRTVDTHVKDICDRLGLPDRKALMLFALQKR